MEGDHPLWDGITDAYKHTIRAFLVHFHTAILRHSTERFNFMNGSVGNFFFAGARLFFRSLEAAIFLFSRYGREALSSLALWTPTPSRTLTAVVSRAQSSISFPMRHSFHSPPSL